MMSKATAGLSNMHGPMSDATRKRLDRYIAAPSQAGWNDIHGIILNAGTWRTVWQAVTRVDPSFPKIGPYEGQAWARIPDALLVARAIRATR